MENTQTRLANFEGTDWHKYNLAKTSEKRLFYELLNELCKIISEIFENSVHVNFKDCIKCYVEPETEPKKAYVDMNGFLWEN